MTENQKLREALRELMSIVSIHQKATRNNFAWAEMKFAEEALALPTEPAHADTWGISRAMVTLYAYECDGLTGEALALPTAEQVDDINVAESFTSVTKTAAPVGERERFEAWWRTVQMRTFPKEYDIERLQDWGSAYKPKALDAWQARAALSAGDAVLADREACAKLCEEVADDLITAMRKEGETDDEVMTSLVASARVCAEEIRGGYSKKFNPHNAAIDAAMRKDTP